MAVLLYTEHPVFTIVHVETPQPTEKWEVDWALLPREGRVMRGISKNYILWGVATTQRMLSILRPSYMTIATQRKSYLRPFCHPSALASSSSPQFAIPNISILIIYHPRSPQSSASNSHIRNTSLQSFVQAKNQYLGKHVGRETVCPGEEPRILKPCVYVCNQLYLSS